jgi:hypothetical protein
MKTTSSSRKLIQPATLAALAIAIICGVSVRTAQAGYIVTLQQVGSNVDATGSGTIDRTALSLLSSGGFAGTGTSPSLSAIITGPTPQGPVDAYGLISGPSNFGSGLFELASSGTGDRVGINGAAGDLYVPVGYVSGTALSDTSTYSNQTFASLAVNPGTYVWTWGSGVHADSFTLQIGVPDSGSTFGLLVVSLVALFGTARFRSRQLA